MPSRGSQSEPGGHFSFSPWTLFEDDGESMLVCNAYPWRVNPILLTGDDYARLQQALEQPSPSMGNELFETLARIGAVIRDGDPAPPALWDGAYRGPFANEVSLSLGPGRDRRTQLEELTGLFELLSAAAPTLKRLRLRISASQDVGGERDLVGAIRKSLSRFSFRDLNVEWWFGSDLLNVDEAFLALLRDHPAIRVLVLDRTELGGGAIDPVFANIHEVAALGNLVHVEIPSRCEPDLVGRVEAWQEATDQAGVTVVPLVSDRYAGSVTRPIDSPEEFQTAEGTLAAVARGLGAALLRSFPWSSVLLNAAVPGVARAGLRKTGASCFLDETGRWALSEQHAEAFLFSAPGELLPFLQYAATGSSPLLGTIEEGWPGCRQCAFAPLCDGYWTPSIDLLRRTGHAARAANLAQLECALRMDSLASYLAAMRTSLRGQRRAPELATTARYVDGQLTLATASEETK